MIVIVTDFGVQGPYVGQMQAVLVRKAPNVPVVELFNDMPRFDPIASSYLLAAYTNEFPPGTVFLCVVDPGVGSATRKPVMLQVDDAWYVGPDNGLLEVVAHRGRQVSWWEIDWRPERLSDSFHGRDLFAPVAAELAVGRQPLSHRCQDRKAFSGPDDLAQIIYCDAFGNAITGLRSAMLDPASRIEVAGQTFSHARTFSDVATGEKFWYGNANGLVELAVNQGHAQQQLGLNPGDLVKFLVP